VSGALQGYAGANRRSKPTNALCWVRAYRRGKQLLRSWLVGEGDDSVQAKQGWKHSLDCMQKTQDPVRFASQRSW